MYRSWCLAAISAVCCTAWPQNSSLTLDEAIRVAMAKPVIEDLQVEIAQARVRMLEAAGRRRIDLLPQVGLFAMTNPVALASSVGAKLLMHAGDVPPSALLEARIAEVQAELARRRLSLHNETEVTRAFFTTAERQRISEKTCVAWNAAVTKRDQVKRQISQARATRLDVLRHEQEILNREAACDEANQALSTAQAQLARLIGGSPDSIRVEEKASTLPALQVPVQDPAELLRVAYVFRAEPHDLRDTIRELKRQVDASRPRRSLSFSLGYTRLGQDGFHALNTNMFYGQGIQPEISLRIPIKGNGAEAYEHQAMALEVRKLERQLDDLEMEFRTEITGMRAQFESRRDSLAMARKRLAVATEVRKAVCRRYTAGLETSAAMAVAQESENEARRQLTRLEYESKTALAGLLAICGLRDRAAGGVALIVARPQTLFASTTDGSHGHLAQ